MPIYINELDSFDEDVELILTSDPNLGAVSDSDIGVLNKAPQSLANRTKWLKARNGLYTKHSTQRVITATGSITQDDVGKHVMVDGTDNLTVNLTDTDNVEDLNIIVIKVFLPQLKTCTITPAAGETIRFDGDYQDNFYLMNDEWVVLMRRSGHWLVMDCSPQVYEVGMCIDGYATGNNVIQRIGTSYNRADLARLWDWVERKLVDGQSLVTEANWQSSGSIFGETMYPYKGCFSKGNGSTTFRVPDDRGMFTRYLDQGRGVDNYRQWEYAGGYEHDYVKNHKHKTDMNPNSNSVDGSGKIATGNEPTEGTLPEYTSGNPVNAGGTSIGATEQIVKNHAKLPLLKL